MELASAAVFHSFARRAGFPASAKGTPDGETRAKFNSLLLAATRAVVDTAALFLVGGRSKTVTRDALEAVGKVAERVRASGCEGGAGGRRGRGRGGAGGRRVRRGGGDYTQAGEYYGHGSGRYADAAAVRGAEHSPVDGAGAELSRMGLPASFPAGVGQLHLQQQQRGGSGTTGGDYVQAGEYYGHDSGRYGAWAAGHSPVADAQPTAAQGPTARLALAATFDPLLTGGAASTGGGGLTADAFARVLKEYRARRTDPPRIAEDARAPLRRLVDAAALQALQEARRALKTKTLTPRVLSEAAARVRYP